MSYVEPDWRQIVDDRIKSKTRRFASSSTGAPKGAPNRFTVVAGHFFFPLLSVSLILYFVLI